MYKLLSMNIVVYGGVNAFKSLIPILMLPVLTNYLSIEEFGLLSLIETIILFIAPVILISVNSAISVEYNQLDRKTLKEYISNALALTILSFLIVSLLILIFKSYLQLFFNVPNSIIQYLALFALLRVVSAVTLSILQISQKVILYAFYSCVQIIVDVVLSIAFVVYLTGGFSGRLFGVYIAFFISTVIGLLYLYKYDYLGKLNLKYSRKILTFSLPLIVHSISGVVIALSDRFFISYFSGNEIVGVYTIAYQISAVMLLVGVSINQAWMPLLFKFLKSGNNKLVNKVSLLLIVLIVMAAGAIYLVSDILFSIFVDPKFYDAKLYFPVLLLGFMCQSLYFLMVNEFFYKKKTALLSFLTFMGAGLNIVLNYIFIQKFGVIGVAYATLITWVAYCVLISIIKAIKF